jgi:glutaredoxin/glutathione-dependent peroxiredoxin
MAIEVGGKLPEATLKTVLRGTTADHTTAELFAGKKVVLLSVPGAFTPTCHGKHLPPYVERLAEFTAKGVDTIACLAVNDPYVLSAWAAASNAGEIVMIADGNASFTRALGLEKDYSGGLMGVRSQRFAMVVDDGVVRHLAVETMPGVGPSGAEAVLAVL